MLKIVDKKWTEEEKDFLLKCLPKIHPLLRWQKNELIRKLLHSDDFFKREMDMEMLHRILTADFQIETNPFTLEIKLSCKKSVKETAPKNIYTRLHRFEVSVEDRYRITGRKIVALLSTNSREKDTPIYKVVRDAFDLNWPKGQTCLVADRTKQQESLRRLNELLHDCNDLYPLN
jgi:hypothetical protein